MDETALKLNYGRNRGLIVSKQTLPPGRKRKREQISSAEEKMCVSFLAFLTHDPVAQAKLPQVILCNKKTVSLAAMQKHLLPGKPSNIRIWREDSAWNNHNVFRRLMSLLMTCLGEYTTSHQITLVVDVAKCHFHRSISALANRLGLRLVYVPAKLTWLLQPADTHCFSRLKSRLRKKWLELRVQSEAGKVSCTEWLLAVFEVAMSVLSGTRWLCAFKAVGLLDEKNLSARILEHLGWQSPPCIPSAPLTEEQLKSVFPRRSRASTSRASLLRWALPEATTKATPAAKPLDVLSAAASSSSTPAVVSVAKGPISSRTRKRCKSSP